MSDYLPVCREAATSAGALLLKHVGKVSVREKGRADLVTEADFAAQQCIQEIVHAHFPEHGFLGEEEMEVPNAKESEYRWIIDPLDGTTNYVHQVPHCAVSIALARETELLVAAVYNPFTEEFFIAERGRGAFLNDRPIRTSDVATLSETLASVGFPTSTREDSLDLQAFLAALPKCQAIRRTGSTALNLAYVAAGRFDAMWCYSAKIWDYAAGILLVREAGGEVTSPIGGPISFEHPTIAASANRTLHRHVLDIQPVGGEEKRSEAS
jgi:myo-inositol-1(or 4)-monophosphatase